MRGGVAFTDTKHQRRSDWNDREGKSAHLKRVVAKCGVAKTIVSGPFKDTLLCSEETHDANSRIEKN
jgi:hypothetical protein